MFPAIRIPLRLAAGIAALALGLACHSAGAQAPPTYAVLSLVGDSLSIVEHAPTTGTQLDRNNRQRVALSDDTFEVPVLRTIRDELKGAGEVALFSSRDPKLFALQDRAVDSDELPPELASAVAELVSKSSATRLVLVTKRSANVSMPLHNGYVGEGKLAGLGFYLDRFMPIAEYNGERASEGFIAPFASLAVSVIDTKTLRTLRHVEVNRAQVFPAFTSTTAGGPWDILTPPQKIKALTEVLEKALHEAMPKALAGN